MSDYLKLVFHFNVLGGYGYVIGIVGYGSEDDCIKIVENSQLEKYSYTYCAFKQRNLFFLHLNVPIFELRKSFVYFNQSAQKGKMAHYYVDKTVNQLVIYIYTYILATEETRKNLSAC
jgi:hypothetical protein